MPSSLAFSFIFLTNSVSEPLTYSAIATAASLALAILIHLIIVSTVWVSPGSRKTWEPPIEDAYSLVETSSSKVIFLLCNASKTSRRVIIFVILAGISSVSFSFSKRILPLLFSIRTADFARTDTPVCVWVFSSVPVSLFVEFILLVTGIKPLVCLYIYLSAAEVAQYGVLHMVIEKDRINDSAVLVKIAVFLLLFIIPHFYRYFLNN